MCRVCILEGNNPQELKLDNFPWEAFSYHPETTAVLQKTDTAILVKFTAEDRFIRAKYKNHNDPVYKDSCVELFLSPKPDTDKRYINFETNANGAMLVGLGVSRHERRLFSEAECSGVTAKAEITDNAFSITLSVPFSFLEGIFGRIDKDNCIMHMNLYKCGDETPKPHYACWSMIETDEPDYHRPEFFGKLILR